MNYSGKVKDFLFAEKLHPSLYDINNIITDFLKEMEAGLIDGDNGFDMYPTYLSVMKKIPPDKPVIVIDAGGTNLRIVLISFNRKMEPEFHYYKTCPLPGTEGRVTKDEFFRIICSALAPVIEKAECIGFCFSFPTRILPDKDGVLERWTKEIDAPELPGTVMCKTLNDYIFNAYGNRKRIVLLNDAPATLLAGLSAGSKAGFSSYIGFILGTGSNTSFMEANRNIIKLSPPVLTGSQVINIESADFSKTPMAAVDIQLDNESSIPGRHKLEKMASGAYLGELTLLVLKKACLYGIFSAKAETEITNTDIIETKELGFFLQKGDNGRSIFNSLNTNDDANIRSILDAVIERAAILCAANITAVSIKCNKEEGDNSPLCITVDGTTYYKLPTIQTRIERLLGKHLKDENKLPFTIVHIDKAPIIGAAAAGLTN